MLCGGVKNKIGRNLAALALFLLSFSVPANAASKVFCSSDDLFCKVDYAPIPVPACERREGYVKLRRKDKTPTRAMPAEMESAFRRIGLRPEDTYWKFLKTLSWLENSFETGCFDRDCGPFQMTSNDWKDCKEVIENSKQNSDRRLDGNLGLKQGWYDAKCNQFPYRVGLTNYSCSTYCAATTLRFGGRWCQWSVLLSAARVAEVPFQFQKKTGHRVRGTRRIPREFGSFQEPLPKMLYTEIPSVEPIVREETSPASSPVLKSE